MTLFTMNGCPLYFILVVDLVHVFLTNVAYGQMTDNPMCHRSYGGCLSHIPEQEFWDAMSTTGPSPQVLDRYCEPAINYLNCSKDYADFCVKARGVYVQAEAILNYVIEVCDGRSVLHDTYVRNYDCIYSVKPHIENCSKEAWRNELLYRNKYRTGDDVHDEKVYKVYSEAECLGKYLIADCLAAQVQESCGQEALTMVVELATRTKHLCTEEEIVDINRQFQDLLRSDESLPARNPLRFFPYAQQQE